MNALQYVALLAVSLGLVGCSGGDGKADRRPKDNQSANSSEEDKSSSSGAQQTSKEAKTSTGSEKQTGGIGSFESKFGEKGAFTGPPQATPETTLKESAKTKNDSAPVDEKPKAAKPKKPAATTKQASIVEGLPEPRSVEVRLDTAENAVATYRDAYVYQDWKAMLRCLDQRSALGEIMNLAVLANVWIESGPPAVLAEKYKID